MKLKESKVIGIMKDKMERFNQDDELRLAAYNWELNIYAHEMELEESYQNGKEEGILLEKRNLTIQLFKSKYPDEDDNFLSNLEAKEYDKIFKMLLENQSLETIKKVIKK